MTDPKSTGQHHTDLMAAIDHEINHYGIGSLAEVIATMLHGRADDGHDAELWRSAAERFTRLSEELVGASLQWEREQRRAKRLEGRASI